MNVAEEQRHVVNTVKRGLAGRKIGDERQQMESVLLVLILLAVSCSRSRQRSEALTNQSVVVPSSDSHQWELSIRCGCVYCKTAQYSSTDLTGSSSTACVSPPFVRLVATQSLASKRQCVADGVVCHIGGDSVNKCTQCLVTGSGNCD